MDTVFKQTLTHKTLNGGKPTDIIHDYEKTYLETQFAEIFLEEHYAGGRKKKNAIYMDIGANIGLSAIYFKDYAKKIYAIEPNSTYFSFLTENTKGYSNIERFNLGIGFDTGADYLRSNPGEERMETIFGKGEKQQEFTSVSIDKFMETNKIEHIDVLKIDAEGAEYPIFMSPGFAKVANKIDFIVGESHYFENLRPSHLVPILEEYGFKVKFLPFNNQFATFRLVGPGGENLTKEYRVDQQTIFEASRN